MDQYSKRVEIRWSDLDPNYHLRHSVYYDWGAYLRLSFLNEHGLPPSLLRQHNIGPILFREECVFKRELLFGDSIEVNLQLSKSRRDFSRFSMVHEIWKNSGTLSALITVDIAWIDTKTRKLTSPGTLIETAFNAIPKTGDFAWIEV